MLRFCDSFDHYQTADLIGTGNGQKWTAILGNNALLVISPGNGRFNGGLRLTNPGSSVAPSKTLDNQATWCVGFAFRFAALPQSSVTLVSLYDAGTTQVDVRLNTDLTLSVTRNGTLLTNGKSTAALTTNTWAYVEFLCTISSSISANTCKVNVNGVNVINVAAGQSTRNTANSTANQIVLGVVSGSGANNQPHDYDDFYVCDGNGSVNNTFLGDVRVECRFPLANGANTAWAANGASAYGCVNNPTPDGDVTFLSDAVTNDLSTFTLAPLSSSPSSIFGVVLNHDSRKTDAGGRSIADAVRSGGANYTGATVSLSNTYQIYQNIYETDPATGAAWTGTGANSVEVGVKEIT